MRTNGERIVWEWNVPLNQLSRAQNLENGAFLRALRRTGNVREAAREIGKAYGTMQHRRGRDTAFAVRWDAALVSAQARLHERGGARRPGEAPPSALASAPRAEGNRTLGGEEVVITRKDGTLQVRRAQPGKLTAACEQAFLAALSATANVALSAAAAGAAEAAFYRRKRNDPGFAREWRLALQQGYEQLEGALLATASVGSGEHDGWRHNDPPPIPPMTANQALQLLYLHQKEARLWATRPDRYARLPGETTEQWSLRNRRTDSYIAELARDAEESQLARVAKAGGLTPARFEAPAPALPDLAQVTGWSKAKRPGVPPGPVETEAPGFAVPPPADPANGEHHPDTAMFGGWRVGDLTPEQRATGAAALDEARRRPWNPTKPRASPNRG